MRIALEPHPDAAAPNLRIGAEASRPAPGFLELRFTVAGDVGIVRLPAAAAFRRADELWRHTCFEAFVRAPGEAGYLELNFASSGAWAAYRFSDYRAGMIPAEKVGPPALVAAFEGDRFDLTASVDLEPALGLLADLPWQIGLAAVIEDRDGAVSHWALRHPPGAPDFHHQHCFAAELPPPKPA